MSMRKLFPKSFIHPNQNAFVKGRSIFDAIRTIDDIVDYTKRNSWSGVLIVIDFEKTFDTLDFQFQIRTLHKFNFGPSFIQWIRVLYKNVSSCVMNNGFTTGPFPLGRGVRQGDPLSPYLFILALETLAIKIRQDSSVQGLKIGEEMIKLSLFADDMTCIIKDRLSFGECSGLKVNDEKTEIVPLENNIQQEKDFPKHSICEVIKIWGIYFGYDERQRNNLNFSQALKSIKKSINVWKWRGLSLFGRIQKVKTFAIPKLMFRASVIPISKELIKEANSIFYNFIWNGKDKVKSLALISDIEMGGLKMLDIQSMISAKRVTCIKKLLEDYSSPWKTILHKPLLPVGGRFVLHCNFQTSKLKINLPAYYKECFDAWSEINEKTPSCYKEIINKINWNNKFLCYDKKSMFRRDIVNLGFVKINLLLTEREGRTGEYWPEVVAGPIFPSTVPSK